MDWSLIEAIANTRAVDLWILFPLGIAVNRLLTKAELPPKKWAEALTRILGTEEWRDAFIRWRLKGRSLATSKSERRRLTSARWSGYFVAKV